MKPGRETPDNGADGGSGLWVRGFGVRGFAARGSGFGKREVRRSCQFGNSQRRTILDT
jgi:hypothetical protein